MPRCTQVFDGHGGVSAAAFAERHLLQALLSQTCFLEKPADALVSQRLPAQRPMHSSCSSEHAFPEF
jgi:serine/threonine protein phosphatase PrpC